MLHKLDAALFVHLYFMLVQCSRDRVTLKFRSPRIHPPRICVASRHCNTHRRSLSGDIKSFLKVFFVGESNKQAMPAFSSSYEALVDAVSACLDRLLFFACCADEQAVQEQKFRAENVIFLDRSSRRARVVAMQLWAAADRVERRVA